ncbi:hypothetical protein LWM68_12595 [Niabella sp. W65]|nr:hypothetical protein [Niabella sp. W65]MCH7363511.1 hypothetical protein [Niabella sp. W65]ULT39430.1 hypothetical protein KRR40_31390 [Niabella sp. I65]
MVKCFLAENDLDDQSQLVVRREIAPNGKSRAFINDTPVNLSQLQSLSELLVDLHQQFDTLSIGDNNFQVDVVDALADTHEALTDYKKASSSGNKQRRNWRCCSSSNYSLKKKAIITVFNTMSWRH